jgi:hypothetical protein
MIQDSIHPCDPENMRAAADWQLERIMAWAYKHLYPDQINALVEEMRPTATLPTTADSAPWLDITYDGFKHSIRHSETENE